MPHLWFQTSDRWHSAPLAGDSVALLPAGPLPLAEDESAPVLLHAAGEEWMVLCANGEVAVNGSPLLAGVRLLRDRDEIVLRGGGQFFYSTERLAAVEPYPNAEPAFCPRCQRPINKPELAVRCPRCRIWMHETDDYHCWTYAPSCQLCPQPTPLDAGFSWSPEEL